MKSLRRSFAALVLLLLSAQSVFADEVIMEETVDHSRSYLFLGIIAIAAVFLIRILIKKKKSR